MKKINIAVLGAGAMGRTHSFCINNIKMFYKDLPYEPVLHTVCTRDPYKAKQAMYDFGALNCSTDENSLICNPSIDIIDICTPNNLHFDTIMKCINNHKHILCEKPLVVTIQQRQSLEKEIINYDKICGVVFNNRNYPSTMRAKEIISQGKLGEIVSFRSSYLHSSATDVNKKAGWKQSGKEGGGVLRDLGSHAIDLLLYMLGDSYNISGIFGKSQIAFKQRLGVDGKPWQTDADEAFYITCTLNNGATGTIEASKIAVGTNDDLSIEIYGTKGAIKWSLMESNYLYFYDSSLSDIQKGFTAIECCGRYDYPSGFFPGIKAPIGWLRGHLHGMYRYIDAVYNNKAFSPSFSDGILINKIMDKAFESDSLGKFINI